MKTIKQIKNNGNAPTLYLQEPIEVLRQKSRIQMHWTEWAKLDKEYERAALPSPDVKWRMEREKRGAGVKLYHGTTIEKAGTILARQGLTPPKRQNIKVSFAHGSMFGPAVYLGTRAKALAYAQSWREEHNGVLIEVLANLGKVYEADVAGDYRHQCDTVHGKAGSTMGINRADEWAVYDRRRVTIVAFEILKVLSTP